MDGLINFTGSLSGEIEEGGGSGVTPHVTATASVNDQTGVPGVTVVRSGPDAAPNFDFNFVNLKGADGAPGAQGPQGLTGATGPAGAQGPRGFTGATGATGPAGADGYSPAVSVTDIPGGHRVTITDETHPLGQNFDVMNGIDGTDGEDGSPGPEGPQGPAGEGVPTGGTAGQYLRKAGPGDYITEWATPAAAEVSFDIDNCQIVTSTDLQGAVEELDAELVSVNSSLTQIMPLQSGVKTGVSLAANSQTEVNVALPTPYLGGGTSYAVIASIVIWSSADKFPYVVRDKGQASFTLRVYNATSSSATVEIDWITVPVTPTT